MVTEMLLGPPGQMVCTQLWGILWQLQVASGLPALPEAAVSTPPPPSDHTGSPAFPGEQPCGQSEGTLVFAYYSEQQPCCQTFGVTSVSDSLLLRGWTALRWKCITRVFCMFPELPLKFVADHRGSVFPLTLWTMSALWKSKPRNRNCSFVQCLERK